MSTEADTVVYTYLKVQHAYTKLAAKFKTNRQLSESKLWSGAPSLIELIQFYKDNNSSPVVEAVVPAVVPVVEAVVEPVIVEPEVTVVEPVVPVVKVKKGKKRKLSVTVVENKAVSEVITIEESSPVVPELSKKEIKKAKKLAKKEKKSKKEVVVISDSPSPPAETNGDSNGLVEEVAPPVVEDVVEEVPVTNGAVNGGMVVAAASGGEEAEDESEEELEQPKKKAKKVKRGQSESFRRVKEEDIVINKQELRNNTFEAKEGADGYGYMANQVLKFTKGKSFRHEKTKKKRGTYKGGEINMGVTSIKFDSD